jgi:urease accessory protein
MDTTMRTTMVTPTEPASLLSLLWLASPALPVGGFSYSEGLEAATEWAGVDDEATATEWLSDQLQLSLARGDLSIVAAAAKALLAQDTTRLMALNDWVLQTRESAEFRLQSLQMGRSLMDWLRHLIPAATADLGLPVDWVPTYPVAFALAATGLQHQGLQTDPQPTPALDMTSLVSAYAFGWCETMSQTAVKSIPLGQSAGQRILLRLAREIPSAVATAMDLEDHQRQAFTPRLAILSAQHEHQYSRLFRS